MSGSIYNNERIGKSLLEAGLIDESQLKKALKIAEEKEAGFVGKELVDLEFLSEEDLVGHFIEKWGCPLFQLTEGAEVNLESIKLIPKDVAKKYNILPVDNIGGIVTVFSAGPLEPYVTREEIKELRELKGCFVRYNLGILSEVEEAVEKYYG